MNEPNVAVMENRILNMEAVVHELIEMKHEQIKINSNVMRTLDLLQQSHTDFTNRFNIETAPKINTLWENRSTFRGGWLMISGLGGIVVGGSIVASFLYSLIKHTP
jgi:hypothetical protein